MAMIVLFLVCRPEVRNHLLNWVNLRPRLGYIPWNPWTPIPCHPHMPNVSKGGGVLT